MTIGAKQAQQSFKQSMKTPQATPRSSNSLVCTFLLIITASKHLGLPKAAATTAPLITHSRAYFAFFVLLQVTQTIGHCFHWLDVHHEPLLGGLLLSWVLHLLFSLLLLLGAMLHRRALLVPWLCSHMILLVVMVVTFVSWTFLSFFVDLLVAVIFPVGAGLFLGLWIFLWRGVRC